MKIRILGFLLACIISLPANASHIFGGELTYNYLGSFTSTTVRYEVTLTLYVDCLLGIPEAIAQDDPAFINFFDNAGNPLFKDYDSIALASRAVIISSAKDICPFPTLFSNPKACLQKEVFKKSFDLPIVNTPGATYTVVNQRCCLNASIVNINMAASTGNTFSASIPANTTTTNNSAVFKNDPVYYILINEPLSYSAAATDADGDSLSYEFGTAFTGGANNNAKPIPTPPPFTTVSYAVPYSYNQPISGLPPIQIDSNTGLITGKPTALGSYLVVICCHEWRNGVIINTTSRVVQMVVTDCFHSRTSGLPSLTLVKENLKIYSDPSASMVKVSFIEGASSIIVTDIFGKTLYTSNLKSNQNSIDLSTTSWTKGMYFVRLVYQGIGNISTKFIAN